ncbi:hypothetical protein ACERNI_03595 [Camelimonas sp. ID_303_24]
MATGAMNSFFMASLLMVNLLMASLLMASLADPASAAANDRQNAMDHISAVLAAEKVCPGFRANLPLIVVLSDKIGLKISVPANKNYIAARMQAYQSEIEQGGRDAGCAAAYGLYGPKGTDVPNLIRRK